MKKIVFVITLLCICFSITAQTVNDAEQLFNEEKYGEAMSLYENLLKKSSRDHLLKYKAARCMLKLGRYEESIPLLEYAAKKNIKKANYYLYDAYFQSYHFDKALLAIKKYIELRGDKITDMSIYDKKIELAELGKRMIERVDDVTITDSVKIDKKNFLEVYKLQKDLGHLAHKSTKLDSVTEVNLGRYYTGRDDKVIVTKPNKDGNLDLYVSYHLVDGWSEESLLSEVLNSDMDENYPFELPDGVTLYFASEGHNSLGGYDIFLTRYNANTNDYSVPINIGMPFNSPSNDYMLVYDEISQIGWFATDRRQSNDTVVVYEFLPSLEKNLLKTENVEERRLSAQLRLYKVGKRNKIEKQQIQEENDLRSEIKFLVNDGIIYTSLSQFKSTKAREMFEKLQMEEKRLLTKKRLLEGKRTQFAVSTNTADKNLLIEEILKTEEEINKTEIKIKDNILLIRTEEIGVLKKNKK